eukprot:346966-Karenia_brevis.AAC.1
MKTEAKAAWLTCVRCLNARQCSRLPLRFGPSQGGSGQASRLRDMRSSGVGLASSSSTSSSS